MFAHSLTSLLSAFVDTLGTREAALELPLLLWTKAWKHYPLSQGPLPWGTTAPRPPKPDPSPRRWERFLAPVPLLLPLPMPDICSTHWPLLVLPPPPRSLGGQKPWPAEQSPSLIPPPGGQLTGRRECEHEGLQSPLGCLLLENTWF